VVTLEAVDAADVFIALEYVLATFCGSIDFV